MAATATVTQGHTATATQQYSKSAT